MKTRSEKGKNEGSKLTATLHSSPVKLKASKACMDLPSLLTGNSYTTPPRAKPPLENLTDSGNFPKTPSKRTKRLLNYSATETRPIPESSSSSTSFRNKLSSSKARRCLFPSSQAIFRQTQQAYESSVADKHQKTIALKIKQWHYDFENDRPLLDSKTASPIWKKEINPPKFYATRSKVKIDQIAAEEKTPSETSGILQEVIKEAIEKVTDTSNSTTSKKVIKRRASSSSSISAKTPQKQQKITATYSPRKSVSPGAKKSGGLQFSKKGLKARRKLTKL